MKDGELVEVPLDYEPQTPLLDESKKTLRFAVGTLSSAVKEIAKANKIYRDARKTFRKDIARRKAERDTIESQYAMEAGKFSYTVSKDGAAHTVVLKGNKLVDGKVLTAFEVVDGEGNATQNVYMDKLNIFSLSNNKMKDFLAEHVDFSSDKDAYIGRPRVRNNQVVQDIDSEFAEHFTKKQDSKEKFQKAYGEFLASKTSSKKGMSFFVKMLEKVAPKEQAEAYGYLSGLAKIKAKVKSHTHTKDTSKEI